MGKLISTTLNLDERKKISNEIRKQITTRKLDNINEFKKLKIMLNLFEKFGREFNQDLPVSCLDLRALHIRLSNNKNDPCEVVLRRVNMKAAV